MQSLHKILFTFFLLSFYIISPTTIACTDFRLMASNGTVIITRSMEFAPDLQSNLRSSPRGRSFSTVAPDGTRGMAWNAKYGYLFLDGFGQDIVIDGMNEAGLSIEALYLPNYAQYQIVPPGKNAQALPYFNFGDWVLGNFQSVKEVKQALNNIYLFAQRIPSLGNMIFPLHFAIYGPTGESIIVEYINGNLAIHDNRLGLLTNAPNYQWHMTNLSNYVYLKTIGPQPILDNGILFNATGQGAGMMGLPGDISPPSRFVKTAVLTHVVLPVSDATGALNLAEHIINNVDIPKGLAREPQDNNKYTNDITQWVVFKDLTHKVFYYRTYDNLSLHAVDMKKINFSENAPRLKMPIASPAYIQDMTATFLKSQVPLHTATGH